jgi:hypothetical protein
MFSSAGFGALGWVRIAAVAACPAELLAQSATLVPPSPIEQGWFGHCVALESGRLAVGAPFSEDPGGLYTGRAYVYERAGGAWSVSADLLASDGEELDRFGIDVALAGATVLVGAESEGPGSIMYGAAYVYVKTAVGWIEQAKLTAPVRVAGSRFGLDVALSGDTAAVAAMQDSSVASLAGSVHVFTRNGATWTHQQQLTVNDVTTQAAFGFGLALDGDVLIASTPYDDWANLFDVGSVHVFERTGTTWNKYAKLSPLAPSGSLRFGASLALQSGTMVVGTFDLPGAAFVLEGAGAVWNQTAELRPLDPDATTFFGVHVALDGSRAAVGALMENVFDPFTPSSGAVYLFDRVGSSWTLVQRLVSPTPAQDDAFSAVALDGVEFAVGETRDGATNIGAVHVYELGGPLSYCTAGTSTNGCTPHLSLDRLASVTSTAPADLVASGLDGQTSGLAFLGAAASATPWAPGSTSTLCALQPLARLPPVAATGGSAGACDGSLVSDVNAFLAAHGGALLGQPVLVGTRVHAQVWFRDVLAPKGSNLSDALAFVFYP